MGVIFQSNQEHRLKCCFAASSGGHLEQILMLRPLMEKYESIAVTEKVSYHTDIPCDRVYYLYQVNRKTLSSYPKMIVNCFRCLKILHREKPDVIICTGALATVPLCVLGKWRHCRLVYIESYAITEKASLTGEFMYKIADRFYVQWETMLRTYPNAVFVGGIY